MGGCRGIIGGKREGLSRNMLKGYMDKAKGGKGQVGEVRLGGEKMEKTVLEQH